MFTLQAGQIENALRMNGAKDISAKEMMQGFANCAAPLEHRGPVALTQPVVNLFPTLAPPIASPGIRVTGPQTKNVFIDIPPFVPYFPPMIPYPPGDEWRDIPYFDPGSFHVPGPVNTGSLTAADVTAGTVNTPVVRVERDSRFGNPGKSDGITNEGDIVNQGDTHNYGDTYTTNQTVENTSITNQTVINNGDVINRGAVYNEIVHNYQTINHGPVHNHSETWMQGPVNMIGPVIVQQPPVVAGVPLDPIAMTVVTDVVWEGNALKKKTRPVTVFGVRGGETTTTLLEGTECPA